MGVALLAASGAQARDLPVPAGKGWQHAQTGIVLRSTIAGLTRTALADNTETERDVVASFDSPDRALHASIFIFRPSAGDAGIWYDRAAAQIEVAGRYGAVTPVEAAPVAMPIPGGVAVAGFRRSYDASKTVRGTSLAVLQYGEWLVTVRVSSGQADGAATGTALTALVAAIGWPPAKPGGVTPPALIAACPTALTFRKAKQVKPSGAGALLQAMAPMLAAEAKAKGEIVQHAPVCREGPPLPSYSVFRSPSGTDGYLLALGDAGITASVDKSAAALLPDEKGAFAISLTDLDGKTTSYAPFDRLPAPAQAFEALNGPASSSTTGKAVTISPNAL